MFAQKGQEKDLQTLGHFLFFIDSLYWIGLNGCGFSHWRL